MSKLRGNLWVLVAVGFFLSVFPTFFFLSSSYSSTWQGILNVQTEKHDSKRNSGDITIFVATSFSYQKEELFAFLFGNPTICLNPTINDAPFLSAQVEDLSVDSNSPVICMPLSVCCCLHTSDAATKSGVFCIESEEASGSSLGKAISSLGLANEKKSLIST